MSENNDLDILNSIYKNSLMAYESTSQVSEKCRSRELKEYLDRQMRHYADNASEARQRIRREGARARKIPAMQRVMSKVGIFMKTAADSSTGNIAELMYNGTNMGIIDIARTVNKSSHASDASIDLAEKLLSNEEKYADGLRKFL